MWAVNGYHFKDDRSALMRVMQAWPVPVEALEALLTGAVPYRVEDGTVVFEVE